MLTKVIRVFMKQIHVCHTCLYFHATVSEKRFNAWHSVKTLRAHINVVKRWKQFGSCCRHWFMSGARNNSNLGGKKITLFWKKVFQKPLKSTFSTSFKEAVNGEFNIT